MRNVKCVCACKNCHYSRARWVTDNQDGLRKYKWNRWKGAVALLFVRLSWEWFVAWNLSVLKSLYYCASDWLGRDNLHKLPLRSIAIARIVPFVRLQPSFTKGSIVCLASAFDIHENSAPKIIRSHEPSRESLRCSRSAANFELHVARGFIRFACHMFACKSPLFYSFKWSSIPKVVISSVESAENFTCYAPKMHAAFEQQSLVSRIHKFIRTSANWP